MKGNMVAVVSDGTAVLGLGDITKGGIASNGRKGDFIKAFCQC